jgi:hypothetical protein
VRSVPPVCIPPVVMPPEVSPAGMSVLAARLRPRRRRRPPPMPPAALALPDISPVMFALPDMSPVILALPDESSVMLALPDMSPEVFALRGVLRRRPRRRLRPPMFDVFDVLLFCVVVIIPPRVCSSLLFCVVEELEFCAETTRSAVTRAIDAMSTNKTVMLRVMLLLLTDVSPFLRCCCHVLIKARDAFIAIVSATAALQLTVIAYRIIEKPIFWKTFFRG